MSSDKYDIKVAIRRPDIVGTGQKSEIRRSLDDISQLTLHREGDYVQLQTRLDTVQDLLKDFNLVQTTLENFELQETGQIDEDLSFKERDDFESKYFNAISDAKRIIDNNSISSVSLNNVPQQYSNTIPVQNVKLPIMKLPEFTGLYSEWQQFYDSFKALIDQNQSLSNIQKFFYLQSALKGEAAQTIAALQVTDANYSIAWDLLKNRYENKKSLIKAHIKEIHDIPNIIKESLVALKKLLDTFQKNYRSLENLGQRVDTWDSILIFILCKKFDAHSKREWEQYSKDMEDPKVSDIIKFLLQRCRILESLDSSNFNNLTRRTGEIKVLHAANSTKIVCPICKDDHYIYFCQKFKGLSINSRYDEIKRLRLCSNCLRAGHKNAECNSSGCKICKRKHNTILHQSNTQVQSYNAIQSETSTENIETQNHETNETTILSHIAQKAHNSMVILSTAMVMAQDLNQHTILCRALLDNGSQSNFVTKALVNKLNLPTQKTKLPVSGISQIKTMINESVKITLNSVNNDFQINLTFFVIDQITDFIPQKRLNVSHIELPKGLQLADPNYHIPRCVDLLLGANVYFDLLKSGHIKLGNQLPILYNTYLGWVISGNFNYNKQVENQSNCFLNSVHEDLNSQLQSFWELEETNSTKKVLSQQEIECEKYFTETTTRDKHGRFIVHLPLKENYIELGESLENAEKRMYSIERKLSKNPTLKTEYQNFIHEYKNLCHMTEITESDSIDKINFYLPHHAVEKSSSTTTRVRVVFDASAKGSNGLSLNSVLKVGPTVQNDLFSQLIKFRQHNVVLIGDLEKMYRQILVHDQHTDLQRIVWRDKPEEKLKHFKLNTVTYGTASASFLATRCLKQIAIDVANSFPLESKIISEDFYVDDLLTGASSHEEVIQIKNNLTKIFSEYGFNLRKFQSNDPRIFESINDVIPKYEINDSTSIKTLGITWFPYSDLFEYNSEIKPDWNNITKRTILSYISRIFDPLGLLGPLTIRAKIILQQLWQIKLDWDEVLPDIYCQQWIKFCEQISTTQIFQIPRQIVFPKAIGIQLHGFCDASEQAYGASIYIRAIYSNNEVSCRLLTAKSRVAPLKTVSLPRLELCGAVLLSQLIDKCKRTLTIPINKTYLWTDSTIVLCWIKREPSTLKTFISNRVSKIHNLTNITDWHHVSSKNNPADIISRGSAAIDLYNSSLWWQGPQFLQDNIADLALESNVNNIECDESDIPELKPQTVSFLVTVKCDIINKYSSFSKLINVTAYIIRFIQNCRLPFENRKLEKLSHDELKESTNMLIKMVQSECFFSDIRALREGSEISKTSKLNSLNPFLDTNGILRVGGRLKESNLNYNNKYPIVLPSNHQFTTLIIRYEHLRHFHAGTIATLSHVRQKYWILNGRSTVRGLIRKCVTCFKAKPIEANQQMGNLPSDRVIPSRIFSKCGIDYAGPFDLKDGKTRSKKIVKGYICIFICLATKAVHLELCTELTSACFLAALKRFVSRRGLCNIIYSDNGTNFIGANRTIVKDFNELTKCSNFKAYFDETQIQWLFIPPRAPHFGGLWEAAVKSAKYHLKRISNNINFTYEEFYTLLTQIEAILNSRPLVPLSSDPNDLQAITPGHFIIGQPLTAIPEGDLKGTTINNVKRFRHVQQMCQHFWSRWSHEYLHTLQQRHKWKFRASNTSLIGALVIIKEDHLPTSRWVMGRIISVHPGSDNLVRVCSVKTYNGVVKRAINKLCLLPNED